MPDGVACSTRRGRLPEDAPVLVLTHKAREPWVRKGGAAFHFVTDAIRQYLRAGAVDEVSLHVAPVLIGDGLYLFESLKPDDLKLEQESVESSPLATHITCRVVR